MREAVDVLFLSYYADIDRWHNDWDDGVRRMPARVWPGLLPAAGGVLRGRRLIDQDHARGA